MIHSVRQFSRVILPLVLLAGLWGVSGCSALNVGQSLSFLSFKSKDKNAPVVEIMALWQPGEGRDVDGLPCRGFAGQIFFFKQGKASPTKITGDIKVYVFDDQGSDEEQRKPIHIYEFKEEAWAAYLTKANIGDAYQIFIPYPRKGSHRALCSVRIKHTAATGEMLLSNPADVLLPGKIIAPPREKQVSAERPTIPSTLSTQQTHIASIHKSGRLKPEISLAEADAASQVKTTYHKNTSVQTYQKKPAGVIQQTAYQEHSTPEAEFGWSLHNPLPVQQASKAQSSQPSANQPAAGPVTTAGGEQPHHSPVTFEAFQAYQQATQANDTTELMHPLAAQQKQAVSNGQNFHSNAHPLAEQHPLQATPEPPSRHSSLRVKTIPLE